MEQFEATMELLAERAGSPLVRQILQLLVCLLCLTSILKATAYSKKRQWATLYYILLCVAVLLWAGGSLLGAYTLEAMGASLRLVGMVFVPALVCLHVWKQVYYHDITPLVLMVTLLVPAVCTGYILYVLLGLGQVPMYSMAPLWLKAVFFTYAVVALVRSFLLCLNVFYQMPRHMRKSTYTMLGGLTAFVVVALGHSLWRGHADYDILLLAVTLALYCFYRAFGRLSSADVIVTSRDFVFGNLGTTVLALSMEGRILDWNKKGQAGDVHLPAPKYKEKFEHYRQRIVQEGDGRVSPHDDNLITIQKGGREHHYLISVQEVSSRQRPYGYLAELYEVTPLYAKFRYLEEIASVDQLTGLYNRNGYIAMVSQLRVADKMPLAVVVGDVNNLKPLNDSHGHLCGDSLLVAVATSIKAALPKDAYACRIGGDEFVILIPGGSGEAAQSLVAEVNHTLDSIHDEAFGTPSVSWGHALLHDAQEDYNEAFARADKMMYIAKKAAHQFKSSGLVPNKAPKPEP